MIIISSSKNKQVHFTKFPNEYIQCDIKKQFGISRKFYVTYLLIDKYRTFENYSWITIKKILNFYGYKTTSHKPKAFQEILDTLAYMVNRKMIEIDQDLDSVTYDTGIEIKIITENFDYSKNYSKVMSKHFRSILVSESSITRENILLAFLYINSYIICRPRDEYGNERLKNPSDKPEAFFRSIEKMAKELSMSKDTVNQCLNYLTTSSNGVDALLIKKEVGSIQPDKTKAPLNVPNIYVLNQEGYQKEIEWALNKMFKMYQVNEFDELKCGKKNQSL